jgi:DtxR family Mn-dependent transcriptional regulator
MADLIDTTEMYLRTILELEEEGQVPLRARISERLEHSGPTVSQTIGRMERLGYVVVSNDRHLELTDFGREEATKVMRKHRLAERLLADVIGLEWEFVHEEACRWEHVISEQVERKIMAMLDNPRFSPYGNPIPGLEELGAPKNQTFIDGVVSVTALALTDTDQTFTLRRIGEPLQVDVALLADLKALGIMPGAEVSIESKESRYFVRATDQTEGESLGASEAAHLFVDAS